MQFLNTDEIIIEQSEIGYFQSDYRKEDYGYIYTVRKITDSGEVIMSEYILDIFQEGQAKLTIDGNTYFFREGSACFYKPGQRNIQHEEYNYSCYTAHFNVYKKDTGELIGNSGKYSCFLDFIPTYSEPKNLTALLKSLISYSKYSGNSDYHRLKREICRAQINFELYSLYKEHHDDSQTIHPSVRKAISYLMHNLDTNISMKEVADVVGLSEKYFQKIFKQSTGQTPNEFLTMKRLEIAEKKLLTTNMPIADIAFESGFSSSTYFSYVFKKVYNQSPKEYKKWNVK